jgi:hypothetical protein
MQPLRRKEAMPLPVEENHRRLWPRAFWAEIMVTVSKVQQPAGPQLQAIPGPTLDPLPLADRLGCPLAFNHGEEK